MTFKSGQDRTGFSLIEALVALAIAAMTLTVIFELQVRMVRAQERASQVLLQVAAQENAIALLRDMNPKEQPVGELQIPEGDLIRWRSEPLNRSVTNAGFPTGDGSFEVQLYRVTVEIETAKGRRPQPLVFDRLGWRRIGGPSSATPSL